MLTRALTFHARHHYRKDGWSDAEHSARFGATGDAGGHGHLYSVQVSVAGPLDPDTQMIIDLAAFDRLLGATITARLDGRSLNTAIPKFAAGTELPSCEAVARWIWLEVASQLPDGVQVHRVRVAEDETLWAECIGPA